MSPSAETVQFFSQNSIFAEEVFGIAMLSLNLHIESPVICSAVSKSESKKIIQKNNPTTETKHQFEII